MVTLAIVCICKKPDLISTVSFIFHSTTESCRVIDANQVRRYRLAVLLLSYCTVFYIAFDSLSIKNSIHLSSYVPPVPFLLRAA